MSTVQVDRPTRFAKSVQPQPSWRDHQYLARLAREYGLPGWMLQHEPSGEPGDTEER